MEENLIKRDPGRIAWVDVLKFLGIFAIYLGHFGNMAGQLYLFVFSYHVPLFFFASGFFFRPPNYKTFLPYVAKKFCSLIVPYYVFTLFEIVVNFIRYNYASGLIRLQLHELLWGRRNHVGSTWFLTGIFTVIILSAILTVIFRNRYLVLSITFLLYVFYPKILSALHIEPLSLFWNLDSAINYLVYFQLGFCLFPLLKKLEWKRKVICLGNVTFLLCAIVSAFIAAVVYFKGEKFLLFSNFLRIPGLLQTLLLILFNCICAKLLIGVPYLQDIGANTLILCGCEFSSKVILASLLALIGIVPKYSSPLTTVFYTAICLVFCYGIFVRFIRQYAPALSGRLTPKQIFEVCKSIIVDWRKGIKSDSEEVIKPE